MHSLHRHPVVLALWARAPPPHIFEDHCKIFTVTVGTLQTCALPNFYITGRLIYASMISCQKNNKIKFR